MGVEIERKFLVKGDRWRSLSSGTAYRQGYLTSGGGRSVRVRIAGESAFLTIKGPSDGLSRLEFEYPIPLADAQQLLDTLCDRPQIHKIRYRIEYEDVIWEVDEFLGDNAGLIVAEVELSNVEQTVALPDWVGQEVSGDPRYFNSYLAKNPFCTWAS